MISSDHICSNGTCCACDRMRIADDVESCTQIFKISCICVCVVSLISISTEIRSPIEIDFYLITHFDCTFTALRIDDRMYYVKVLQHIDIN